VIDEHRIDSLPTSQEDLQRLVTEAQYFVLPELAAAARQRLQRDRQATETDRRVLRSLLEEACGSEMADERRTAVVARVERMCGGEFSLRTLREQDQRVADMSMLERLVGRAAFAAELEEERGLSAPTAAALTNDWTGRYCSRGAIRQITDGEAERLGLAPADVEALPAGLQQFTFREVRNENAETCSFDNGGVLYHIGTEGGTSAWVNPHDAGRVVASWSGDNTGAAKNIVNGPGPEHFMKNYTADVANSWVAVDLGATRSLVVEHYALRHSKDNGHELRNWELQGAPAPDGPWTTLRRHDNDQTIVRNNNVQAAAWPVEGAAAFRAFRIHNHGKDNNNYDYLMCSGIEFWGVLTEE